MPETDPILSASAQDAEQSWQRFVIRHRKRQAAMLGVWCGGGGSVALLVSGSHEVAGDLAEAAQNPKLLGAVVLATVAIVSARIDSRL